MGTFISRVYSEEWGSPMIRDITFGNSERFWPAVVLLLLFLIPVFLEWRKRNKILESPWHKLHRETSRIPTKSRRFGWWTVFVAAIMLCIAAYANPERVKMSVKRVFEQIRVTIILDISRSMKKAEDVEPNRLEAAKAVIRLFLQMLEHDEELSGRYELALIPFSGAALPYYLPFTTSRDEFLSHLEFLDVETITKRGSSLQAALLAYNELLFANPLRNPQTADLGILISDGGKEEAKSERALLPQTVASLRNPYLAPRFSVSGERTIVRKETSQRNVTLYTVGVGKVEIDAGGKRVAKPVLLKNRDKAGNFMGYQHMDETNPASPVEASTLDEQILVELARLGGGEYRHFADRETVLREFKAFILKHRKEADPISLPPQYESLRAWFLVPSFIMFYFLFGYGGWLLRSAQAISRLTRRLIT